jgi:hypothetical protein
MISNKELTIRDMSETAIGSLEKLGDFNFSFDDYRSQISYMIKNNKVDLTKAKDIFDLALGTLISKNPKKQGLGQKQQGKMLARAFGKEAGNVLIPGTVALIKGKRVLKENARSGIMTDIDFEWKEKIGKKDYHYLLSSKWTNDNGGSQNDQFNEMVALINEAPKKKTAGNTYLALQLDGSFWTDKRMSYLNWEKQYKFPCTLTDLLKKMSKGKKVIIFSSSELPKKKTTFYKQFLGKRK